MVCGCSRKEIQYELLGIFTLVNVNQNLSDERSFYFCIVSGLHVSNKFDIFAQLFGGYARVIPLDKSVLKYIFGNLTLGS